MFVQVSIRRVTLRCTTPWRAAAVPVAWWKRSRLICPTATGRILASTVALIWPITMSSFQRWKRKPANKNEAKSAPATLTLAYHLCLVKCRVPVTHILLVNRQQWNLILSSPPLLLDLNGPLWHRCSLFPVSMTNLSICSNSLSREVKVVHTSSTRCKYLVSLFWNGNFESGFWKWILKQGERWLRSCGRARAADWSPRRGRHLLRELQNHSRLEICTDSFFTFRLLFWHTRRIWLSK